MKKLLLIVMFALLPLVAFAQSPTQTHTFNLVWVDNSSNPQEAGFKVERCQGAGCGTFTEIGQVAQNIVNFKSTITNDPGQITYCFRVKGFSTTANVTDSPYSNIACAATPVIPPVQLNPPSGLTISAISSSTLELSWKDNSVGETVQKIYWESQKPPRAGQIVVAANDVSYRMSNLRKRTTYCAAITAIAGSVESSPSNVSCGTTRR